MGRYIVNDGYEVPYNGERVGPGTTVEGELGHWVELGWVTPSGFPLQNYSKLSAKQIITRLKDLSDDELKTIIEHESGQSRPRVTVIKEAERLLNK